MIYFKSYLKAKEEKRLKKDAKTLIVKFSSVKMVVAEELSKKTVFGQ